MTLEATEISLGLSYHAEFAPIPETDWVAALSYGQVEVSLGATDNVNSVTVSTKENYVEVYGGLRRTLSARLEAVAGLSIVLLDGDSSGSGDITLVYRLADRLDVSLGLNGVTEEDTVGIGLRLTW